MTHLSVTCGTPEPSRDSERRMLSETALPTRKVPELFVDNGFTDRPIPEPAANTEVDRTFLEPTTG